MASSFSQPPLFSSLVPINTNKNKFPKFKISSSDSKPEPEEENPMKLAFAKAKTYKKSTTQNTTGINKEVPLAVKLAFEKANDYKNKSNKGSRVSPHNKKPIENSSGKKEKLSISSIDFMGLGFSDNKTGGSLPAGLVPQSDPFSEGALPEVEILVGDTSSFSDGLTESKGIPFSEGALPEVEILVRDTSSFSDGLTESKGIPVQENDAQVYKPKVSTWGRFPRPSDISKAYGGARTIRPGEALETAEERAAKEARTKQMVAAYKTQIGLNIDPKLKSECEKALKDGDLLLDLGELKEALPFYEKVMEKLPFKTELHGLAALQWSICQDSLSRSNEARIMYEKLQSHPSPKVSKKARQFIFDFQAMEIMKVTSSTSSPLTTDYQNYFDAFLQDKKNYASKEDEADQGGLSQALPYIIFLVSPIFMVLLIAASKF